MTSQSLVRFLKETEGKKILQLLKAQCFDQFFFMLAGILCQSESPERQPNCPPQTTRTSNIPCLCKKCCLQYPMQSQHPATCGAFGFYLIFTSYYCHSAKLILETKGYFVKSRLQLSEYESALLILAAVVSNALDKPLLRTEQGTGLAGPGPSSVTGLPADLRHVTSFISCFLFLPSFCPVCPHCPVPETDSFSVHLYCT